MRRAAAFGGGVVCASLVMLSVPPKVGSAAPEYRVNSRPASLRLGLIAGRLPGLCTAPSNEGTEALPRRRQFVSRPRPLFSLPKGCCYADRDKYKEGRR